MKRRTTEKTVKLQRVAIIADEAHRSHTSSTRDAIEKVVKAGEGSHAQLTFIGLTATPNTDALELFGSRSINGFRRPLPLRPIAKATADGRITDMLKDYTCMHCEIETSVFPMPATRIATDASHAGGKQPKVKCMIVVRSRRDVVRYYTLITTFVAKKKLRLELLRCFQADFK
ncbi:unnamed protein product [Peronospora destructor]|uniref:Helicase/UvrB N-terminal domain-containing protein n=1 Tax=Peronospora destructor TaxID=86335 RepID=A0AAV0VB37_9STRA|nr:unnamed protein product [Peronospora destructor]